MAHKALAILTIILGASLSTAYLYYAPSHLALTLSDPPPTPYSNNITAIYVTLTTIEIHAANAGNKSGWQTLATDVTVNPSQHSRHQNSSAQPSYHQADTPNSGSLPA